jgi:hypothetical protein
MDWTLIVAIATLIVGVGALLFPTKDWVNALIYEHIRPFLLKKGLSDEYRIVIAKFHTSPGITDSEVENEIAKAISDEIKERKPFKY